MKEYNVSAEILQKEKKMKKKLLVGLVLACAMALPLAFTACGDTGDGGDNNGGGNNVTDQVDATWKKAIEDFCTESGVANSDVMTEILSEFHPRKRQIYRRVDLLGQRLCLQECRDRHERHQSRQPLV